jgi:hypothetical protein
MKKSPPVKLHRVSIVRARTGYQVVPGTHVTAGEERVRFANLADGDAELQNGTPPLFPHGNVIIPRGAVQDVVVATNPGVYPYEVQLGGPGGFYAEGDSSPRIIVDPLP